jgi:hypothetical protein
LTEESAATVAVDGSTRYTLLADRVRVETDGRVRDEPLDDPGVPAFLHLPAADLGDGRSLRRAAFDAWQANVRAAVANGRDFETNYRAPRPFVTALTILGAACVSGLCALLLVTWAVRPDGRVVVNPTTSESAAIVLAVLTVVAIIVVTVAALVRAWRCRRGSYVHLGVHGMRTAQGGRAGPLSGVAAAAWHPLVRCTRIEFMDGRADLWVPAESGALRRVDLLLAALDDRLGAALRAAL